MAESLKENLVDLLAGMPKENSIPSGEDTTGVNLKLKLSRGNSTVILMSINGYNLHWTKEKTVTVTCQMMMVMAPIPTAMQSILTKMINLLALLHSIKTWVHRPWRAALVQTLCL